MSSLNPPPPFPPKVDTSASSYGYRVASRAVDLYETAGKGGPALAVGLRWEVLPMIRQIRHQYAQEGAGKASPGKQVH